MILFNYTASVYNIIRCDSPCLESGIHAPLPALLKYLHIDSDACVRIPQRSSSLINAPIALSD